MAGRLTAVVRGRAALLRCRSLAPLPQCGPSPLPELGNVAQSAYHTSRRESRSSKDFSSEIICARLDAMEEKIDRSHHMLRTSMEGLKTEIRTLLASCDKEDRAFSQNLNEMEADSKRRFARLRVAEFTCGVAIGLLLLNWSTLKNI